MAQRALQGQGEGEAARIHTRGAKPWGLGERSGGSADSHCGGKGVPPCAGSLLPHLFPDRSWQVFLGPGKSYAGQTLCTTSQGT